MRAWITSLALGLLLLVLGADVRAENGTITGKVVDSTTGKPLGFANVVLIGTTLGAVSKDDGSFVIQGVIPGSHAVQASYMGYEPERLPAVVTSGGTTSLSFKLRPTVAKKEKEVIVTAERPLVEVDRASTTHAFTSEEMKKLVVEEPTIDAIVEQQPGITRDNGQLHFRGGRGEETLTIVDGVQMRDVLSGQSEGSNVSARSAAEVTIITGGFDAQYGQALSGIVEVKLKEGQDAYEGYLGFTTDAPLGDYNTYQSNAQLSGPLPLIGRILRPLGGADQKTPTFFLDLSADFTDGYLPSVKDLRGGRSLRSGYRESLFGTDYRYGSFFYPRASNDWRLSWKGAWKASGNHKFTLVFMKSLEFDQGFNDTDVADVDRNKINYPWAWVDRLDHYYTVTSDQNSASLGWTQVVRSNLFHTVKLARYFSSRNQSVGGKLWSAYDRDFDFNHRDEGTDRPYYVDYGDASDFRDRYVENTSADWDWQWKPPDHDVRWGTRIQYENVQYLSLDASTVSRSKPLGNSFDLFHVYPTTGAFYVQDGMSYEGLTARAGLRYDYWFPGEQVERAYERGDRPTLNEETRAEFMRDTRGLFGHRFKGHFSPRIQVSHPISLNDHLFFNYGHFTQRPPYFYVYAKSSSQSSEEFPLIGNPNLNPEISVQYELGAGHKIREGMALKGSLFYKDIYDYPTSTTLVISERSSSRSNFFFYRNLDYARARGIELELKKQGKVHSWSLSYTYSVVKGKSSDPNKLKIVQGSGGDARETALDEEFMWWNRPHKLTAWYNWRVPEGAEGARALGFIPVPQGLTVNLYLRLESGRAYTPQDIFGHQTGTPYSKNGPLESALNATVQKTLDFGGRDLELKLQGWNILDRRTLLVVDPATGKKYKPGNGVLTGSYDAATIEQYKNPSYRAEPRHFRLGLGMEF